MKKALIVGGSNGIGLAIAKNLAGRGYALIIADREAPDEAALLAACGEAPDEAALSAACGSAQKDPGGLTREHPGAITQEDEGSRTEEDAAAGIACDGSALPQTTFCRVDLLDRDVSLFETLSKDPEIEVLMITAGFGRVADFEWLHTREIENLIQVNTTAGIQIVRCFYDRIKNEKPFYCGMMGSIAGLVSSPMFSVYAASKAAVCRFIESVNIEVEAAGFENRILNVSPGSIKGSRFNGGANDLSEMSALSSEIVRRLFAREVLYIPDYEAVYKDVLERYHADAHAYGLSSYEYKKQSGRVFNEKRIKIGYLSGTFDLFHVGHLNLLERAKQHCDYLIVGVHPSAKHKGKEAFIPFEERCRIVGACRYVDRVIESLPEDMDVWKMIPYDYLFVGSDYKGTERFRRYEEFFADKGVQIIYFPYTEGTSSTQLRELIEPQKEAGVKSPGREKQGRL